MTQYPCGAKREQGDEVRENNFRIEESIFKLDVLV